MLSSAADSKLSSIFQWFKSNLKLYENVQIFEKGVGTRIQQAESIEGEKYLIIILREDRIIAVKITRITIPNMRRR